MSSTGNGAWLCHLDMWQGKFRAVWYTPHIKWRLVRTCWRAQETQLSDPWWPEWEGNPEKRGGINTYGASQVVLVVKKPPTNEGDARDVGSVPGSGRSPGGGHGNPLWYSCLENPMDKEAWQAIVHRVTQRWTQLKRQHTSMDVYIQLIHFAVQQKWTQHCKATILQ